ncbi:MAG: type II toxin-antitoxin system prevent-host-death family antitoxin [Thermoleophilia bacterium]|nr:type II toxin-antitoxin system prevent-host-death family antitoxin [Thermoleophilia bacterium]
MEQIGIRELRQDLSNRVKNAARGESVVVTVDGEPKAKLVPFVEHRGEVTMEYLIATGQVIPARRRGERPPPPPPMVKANRPSKEILDEIRAERI